MLTFSIILSILFFIVGVIKLIPVKPISTHLEKFGFANYVLNTVGVLEILGAIGLQFKEFSTVAALGLLILMLAAIAVHVKMQHALTKLIPPFLMAVFTSIYICLNLA